MSKEKILFICEHNSARSQMAEAFLKKHGGDRFEAESAGLEPTTINPVVVEAMKEIGIDLSGKTTQSVFELFKAGRMFGHVITVCEEADAKCPIFPGVARRLHWPFRDPSRLEGTREERLALTREIRDQIENTVKSWLDRQ